MFSPVKTVVSIALGAALMTSVVVVDASAAVRFDPGLATMPNATAAIEKTWWHRHWHRRNGYHFHWHWHRHWR